MNTRHSFELEKLQAPDVRKMWRSTRSLSRSRSAALGVARGILAQRRAQGQPASQVMMNVHAGQYHLDFFQDQLPQIIKTLPENFRAIEVGAGMGWQSALLAARGARLVLATEMAWGSHNPYNHFNIHALHRLAQREASLKRTIAFRMSDGGELVSIQFPPNLAFAQASAMALPARDGCLDFIYSMDCLEHIMDLDGCFREAARVLRMDGTLFFSGQPLYYCAHGHHLSDFFPVPWGHLLWEDEELAEIAMREIGEGREWMPGEPLRADHIVNILRCELNHVQPASVRRALRGGPWRIAGWVDVTLPGDEAMAKEIGLQDAIRGVPAEALFLFGLRIWLQKGRVPQGLRAPFFLSHRARFRVRRAKEILCSKSRRTQVTEEL